MGQLYLIKNCEIHWDVAFLYFEYNNFVYAERSYLACPLKQWLQ